MTIAETKKKMADWEIADWARELIELERGNPSLSSPLELSSDNLDDDAAWQLGWYDAKEGLSAGKAIERVKEKRIKEYVKGWAWWHAPGHNGVQ